MVLSTFCRLIQLTFMLIMSSLLTPSATSSSDMLFIRHGRSRVRHSNEKDYLRWSLKALDNLTLDYDITDSYDNDTLILFGNDIWSLDNMTYFNQTSNYSSSFSSSAKPSDERLLPTTMTPATSPRKKVPKKKLMESIRKNVDKGLEYLKMHQNLQVPVNNQEFGYQSDDASSKLLLRNDATKPPSESELAKVSTTETTKPEGYASYAYKNLPHSVPARLSVPYKQQLVTREGDTNNLDNNDRNVSAINLSIDDDDTQSIRHGLSMDDDGMEIDGGPYQAPSTSGFSNGASGESPSGNVDEGDDAEDDDDSILANVYGTSDEDLSDLDEISRKNRLNLMKGRDVVTKFLQIVESQHLLGANCTAGTALNLGEGVVDQYAQDRFRIEAEVAVNRANMLTRIFKLTSPSVQASEHLLHASVLSMVEFDDDIFAAGNCFDWNQHPSKSGLFCPFAYRLPPPDQGASFAKDLAAEYHYLGNTSEWFFLARKNAEKVIARNDQYIKAYHYYSNSTSREADVILSVKYDDGRWSKPYYDCGGGNIWMLTYTVPFFGFENETYFFKGTSGIDIDLRRVDIDQCPQRSMPGTIQPLNIFAGTDKCKQRTTMCEPITGLGFRRGSYKCLCRKGFYFPETTAIQKYFNGSVLEEEYEKLMLGETSTYSKSLTYECLPCAEGCDFCEDSSPCVAALNWTMRTSILVLACAVIGLLPPAAWFTFRYQQVKVVRAASPALLRVIALGAFFIYCTTIVMYPPPSLYTCTARIWLREIGFSLTYGALMLKTWRISVIFRVRSAKAVKITDAALLKRLGVICGAIGACLLIRTVVSPPEVVVGRTADDLKAFLCKTDWWDYTFTSMEVLFLAWGVRLCIMVRKAPSEFNESRFISMAIYNEFLLTCFLNVSMLFLQSPANPDLLYIIFFCHTQLTVTLLLGLIFGSKVYIVLRSGKSQENTIGLGAKSSGAKFNFRPQIRTFANPSTATSSTAQLAETRLTDQEALEELRQLSFQLQRIQELAPPRGAAVMTISSLLDGLKTTTHQLAIKPPSSNTLPIPALGNDLQKPNTSKRPVSTLEKSINTQLTGDDFWQQLSIEKSNSRNSNCHHITITDDDCNQHPLEIHRKERCDLSFSELHLECMCAEAVEDIESLGDQNHHRHSFDRIDNITNRDRCTMLSDRHKQLKSPTKPKFHSSCNLNQSKTNNSNLCDNHKSNDHFLICDNCKKKFVNIESKAIEVSLDSHDDISFHSSDNDDHRQTQQCASDSQNQAFSSINLESDYANNDNGTDLKKGQSRKSEKLVLDLNDRSKYTKEVSV